MVINQEGYIAIGGIFIVLVIFCWIRRVENAADDVHTDSIDEQLI